MQPRCRCAAARPCAEKQSLQRVSTSKRTAKIADITDVTKRVINMHAEPISQRDANEYVERMHRHYGPVQGDKFRVAAVHNGNIVGVVQVGRPVSRILDDGMTLEVTRMCTDGTPNACSFLYSRAARIAREMGYQKIITYILCSESGYSLRAAGWELECSIRGHTWDCPSRPRLTDAPTCDKERWAKILTDRKGRKND